MGDTITLADNPTETPMPGYKKVTPMVYCGVYPAEGEKYENVRDALEKLQVNDAALEFEPETSVALGFGFRCGFLGLLHMEIIQERLEREFNLDIDYYTACAKGNKTCIVASLIDSYVSFLIFQATMSKMNIYNIDSRRKSSQAQAVIKHIYKDMFYQQHGCTDGNLRAFCSGVWEGWGTRSSITRGERGQ